MFCTRCGAALPAPSANCPQCGGTGSVPISSGASTVGAATAPWHGGSAAPTYAGPQETDGKALGSLILGILAIFPFGLLTGIPAVILGHLSRKSIRESMGRLKGDGMALAGLIMGYFSFALAIPFILIILAIAVPSVMRAKMLANESAAAATVRTLNTSQATYVQMFANAGYARDLATLGSGSLTACSGAEASAEHACLIDDKLGNSTCTSNSWCERVGYNFNLTATCAPHGACSDYVAVATPQQPGTTGRMDFCSTSDGIIRVRPHSDAAGLSPPTVAECNAWLPLK